MFEASCHAPGNPSFDTLYQEQRKHTLWDSSKYLQEGNSSFNIISQERVAGCEDRIVDALCHEQIGGSLQSFAQQANLFSTTHADIAGQPCLENSPVDGPPTYGTQHFQAPNALNIFSSSGQESLLHPIRAEVMAPYFEESPFDGYTTYDSILAQNFELPSTLKMYQGIDPLLHPTHAEVTAPYFERNPYDGYSIYDSFPAQQSETPGTLEINPSSGCQATNPLLQITKAPYI